MGSKSRHLINRGTPILCVFVAGWAAVGSAQEGPVPKGIPHLDHVFVIMMENHGYDQIFNNQNAPFINQLAHSGNQATNYFAVGHPSLTNYLEVVGGSNFGIRSDHDPDWHNPLCRANIMSGVTATERPRGAVCPIAGIGTDAETPARDCTNEVQIPDSQPERCYYDLDGTLLVPSAPTVGKSIADQLVERGKTWKSYQEDLPPSGADRVNFSDGFLTDTTDFTNLLPLWAPFKRLSTDTITMVRKVDSPAQARADIVQLYGVKHNPFAYFRNVQEGGDPRNSLRNVVGFDGSDGLFADLASNNLPNFSFIAPNQCNDHHGRDNAGAFCNYDSPGHDGKPSGLNGAVIRRGDIAVQRIVTAIKDSPAWRKGNNVIVLLWDENDFSATPNHVLLIVDKSYGDEGFQSNRFYTHFSLLKSLEAGFGLPCLNHACDSSADIMSDLFRSSTH